VTYPRVGVIGLGRVGLTTAVGLAELGWTVFAADEDRDAALRIASGAMPFFEPHVGERLRRHLASGRLVVAASLEDSVRNSDVLFVCADARQREDGSADLSQVEAAARTIAGGLNGYKLIVEKRTSPVSTAAQIRRTIRRHRDGDGDFDVAVDPAFLRGGNAYRDFLDPDRIVLGVDSERARELLLQIYRPLLDRIEAAKVVVTDLNTAEIIKHASNAFLATKVSFINMIADLCEASGADVTVVAEAMGLDARIGPAFLAAGAGFGGRSLVKDLSALIRIAEDMGVDAGLLRAVEAVNRARVALIVRKLQRSLWVLRGKSIAILGLAFKPGTDDVREAPSLQIIDRLSREGAFLRLHDPEAVPASRREVPEDPPRVSYWESAYEAAQGAHAVVFLTEWEEYEKLDLGRMAAHMATPCMVDARNLFDPVSARETGFEYSSVGRP